jgi:hypothetical protein
MIDDSKQLKQKNKKIAIKFVKNIRNLLLIGIEPIPLNYDFNALTVMQQKLMQANGIV